MAHCCQRGVSSPNGCVVQRLGLAFHALSNQASSGQITDPNPGVVVDQRPAKREQDRSSCVEICRTVLQETTLSGRRGQRRPVSFVVGARVQQGAEGRTVSAPTFSVGPRIQARQGVKGRHVPGLACPHVQAAPLGQPELQRRRSLGGDFDQALHSLTVFQGLVVCGFCC